MLQKKLTFVIVKPESRSAPWTRHRLIVVDLRCTRFPCGRGPEGCECGGQERVDIVVKRAPIGGAGKQSKVRRYAMHSNGFKTLEATELKS